MQVVRAKQAGHFPLFTLKQPQRLTVTDVASVLKGPIHRQTVRAKQAGHFPLFN
jgi:hypothetical protein